MVQWPEVAFHSMRPRIRWPAAVKIRIDGNVTVKTRIKNSVVEQFSVAGRTLWNRVVFSSAIVAQFRHSFKTHCVTLHDPKDCSCFYSLIFTIVYSKKYYVLRLVHTGRVAWRCSAVRCRATPHDTATQHIFGVTVPDRCRLNSKDSTVYYIISWQYTTVAQQ